MLAPETPPPSGNIIFSESVPSESPSMNNDASNEDAINFYKEPESQKQLSYHYGDTLSHMNGYSEVEFSSYQSIDMMAQPYIVNINSDRMNHVIEPINLVNHMSDGVCCFIKAFNL